ncbi:hypothetical protein JS533_001495 [Bifidobacterium amazonense]|uniref:Uncharacterized protein n=1 Tax=Bifidobacterium amazonense TaxID=2809027 RepID=A0ABS9VSA6_9BIFI|nr:hypothetical protein [Bifidobacterium amazonense]MCH9274963.1 hypothetical protein [Bifidobacterium amazonense]
MMFVPVDEQRFGTLRADQVSPKMGKDGAQKITRDGVSQWVVTVLRSVPGRSTKPIRITVASPVCPDLTQGAEVAVENLVAMDYSFVNTEGETIHGVAFFADAVTEVR